MGLVVGFHIRGKSPKGCESEVELCACYMVEFLSPYIILPRAVSAKQALYISRKEEK